MKAKSATGGKPADLRRGRAMNRPFAALTVAAAVLIPAVVLAGPLDQAKAGLDALDKGDNAAAIRLFTQALASKQLAKADRELAYVKRAEAYAAAGNNALALADLAAAEKLDSGDQEAQQLYKRLTGPQSLSLADTLGLIVRLLGEDQPVRYSVHVEDPSKGSPFDAEWYHNISSVSETPDHCRFRLTSTYYMNNKTPSTLGFDIGLNDFKEVIVRTEEEAELDHPSLPAGVSFKSNPEVYDFIIVTSSHNATSRYHMTISNKEKIQILSEAISHAGDLCKSKNPG